MCQIDNWFLSLLFIIIFLTDAVPTGSASKIWARIWTRKNSTLGICIASNTSWKRVFFFYVSPPRYLCSFLLLGPMEHRPLWNELISFKNRRRLELLPLIKINFNLFAIEISQQFYFLISILELASGSWAGLKIDAATANRSSIFFTKISVQGIATGSWKLFRLEKVEALERFLQLYQLWYHVHLAVTSSTSEHQLALFQRLYLIQNAIKHDVQPRKVGVFFWM